MDEALVDSNGAVKVNDKLQLDDPKYPYIFALGDASNLDAPKVGTAAHRQGLHVAAEIAAVLHKKQSDFKTFTVSAEPLILPLGPNGGVSQLPLFSGWVLGDWFTWLIRSRDMGVLLLWRFLNAKAPNWRQALQCKSHVR